MSISNIDGVPVMCTTVLSKKLGFYASAEFIEGLGIIPKMKSPTGIYWRDCDFELICELIKNHLTKLQDSK